MGNHGKVSGKKILAGLAFPLFILLTHQINASHNNSIYFFNPLTDNTDTTPVPQPTKRSTDTVKPTTQTTDTSRGRDTTVTREFTLDTLKISKDSLDAPLHYTAADSGVLIIPTKEFLLYGKAHTAYKDITLDAGFMKYEQSSQTILAYGAIDSANNPLDKPMLVQGESKTISDTILYNMKSGRGLTKNTFYSEGEIFVNAQVLKRQVEFEEDVVYAYRTQFTTCNLDTPHFAFRTKKMKMVSNKLAVSGPAHPEFEGVPIPVYLPFGLYPMQKGRHSGIIAPQFAANEDFGLGLEGGGYYKVFGEHVDVTLLGNIYSYGGWNLNINPRYYMRYRYQGSFNLALQHTKFLNRFGTSKDEFSVSRSFQVAWTHTRDNKARPGTSFSASVNAGSPNYNKNIPNNPNQNFINQLSSSIQWSKTTPGTNLTITANHNQNNETRLINLNLPTVTYSVLTLYPFQRKEESRIGAEKWYEKFGISYSGNFQNQASFYDSAFNFRRLLDTTQWGITHSLPLTLALPPMGPVVVSPGISYEEKWVGQKIIRRWNPGKKNLDTIVERGFYTPRQLQVSLSANTRIFGTYNFPRSKGVTAIRHEIRPTIGISYKPDLASKYFYDVQIDTTGRTFRYSEFDGSLFPGYSEGTFGGITYGIDNLLEMKVRNRKRAEGDTSAENETRKIRLIDGIGFNGSYNLFADSTQWAWSEVNLYLRSILFDKINITFNAILDPYDVDSSGFKTKRLFISNHQFRPGRITRGNIAVSASFQSKDGQQATDKTIPRDEFVTPDQQQQMMDYVRNNPAEFVDFNIPWNINFSYSLNFYREYDPSIYNFKTVTNSNINLNGDFSLSPKWKIGGSTYFDFKTGNIEQLSMFVSRDMHCWQMAINIIPIGPFRSFSITLNPKSGLLRDLRINRSRAFYTRQ